MHLLIKKIKIYNIPKVLNVIHTNSTQPHFGVSAGMKLNKYHIHYASSSEENADHFVQGQSNPPHAADTMK